MTNAATIKMLIEWIDAGVITGSKAALKRLRRTKCAFYKGENKLGDKVYDLGRLPREQSTKYLYLHPFTKPNAAGATHRAYVRTAP